MIPANQWSHSHWDNSRMPQRHHVANHIFPSNSHNHEQIIWNGSMSLLLITAINHRLHCSISYLPYTPPPLKCGHLIGGGSKVLVMSPLGITTLSPNWDHLLMNTAFQHQPLGKGVEEANCSAYPKSDSLWDRLSNSSPRGHSPAPVSPTASWDWL